MHTKPIAHRDIKPQNILKQSDNYYVLSDYGEGINLNYHENYLEKVDFSVNEEGWIAAGTKLFSDPLIYKEVKERKNNGMVKGLDLFKADIFSMGLTFLFTASCGGPKSIKDLNISEKAEELIYNRVN